MISSFSYSKKPEIDPDTLPKNPLIMNVYSGLSQSVVEYLESHLDTRQLSQFLSSVHSVEIDSNQAVLLNLAASYYGLQDIVGDSSNVEILRFFSETNHPEILDDETSWCSSYLCWCAQNAKLESSTSLLARSWLDIGSAVESPKTGDIVIFWREKQKSWQGHVSVFINEDPITGQVFCLGGNQDDKVCVKAYPTEQVLGYRRLQPLPNRF